MHNLSTFCEFNSRLYVRNLSKTYENKIKEKALKEYMKKMKEYMKNLSILAPNLKLWNCELIDHGVNRATRLR